MHILMWVDEDQLRDVVIFDPIAYFVTPATIIISKLTPSRDDSTNHETDLHRYARRMLPDQYNDMVKKGVIADVLIPMLRRNYAGRIPQIVRLMVKYGLLVPIINSKIELEHENTNADTNSGSNSQLLLECVEEYIAPALLPDIDMSSPLMGKYCLMFVV